MKFLLLCFLHFSPLNRFQKFSPAAILFSELLHLLIEDSPIHCSLKGDQYSFWLFALIWNEKLCIAKICLVLFIILVLGCIIMARVDRNTFLCFDEIKLLSAITQT